MTTINRNLHWSAVIGVAFSFWLLIWLIFIVAALYDLKEQSSSGIELFLVVVGVFALWAAYRAKKRLDLLRHGKLSSAKIVRKKRESHDYDSGSTNIVTDCFYHYQVDGKSYSHMIVWTFGLKGAINILYNTRNPNYSAFVSRLRARFDPAANEWRSSMWHVIPRLTFMAIIVVGIVGLLLGVSLPFS